MSGSAAGKRARGLWPGLVALAAATGYLIALLAAERQAIIIALLAAGIAVVLAAAWFGLLDRSAARSPITRMRSAAVP